LFIINLLKVGDVSLVSISYNFSTDQIIYSWKQCYVFQLLHLSSGASLWCVKVFCFVTCLL